MTLYALSFDLLFSLPSLEQHHFPSPSHLGHWMNLTYGLQSQCTWRLLEVGHEFISMPRSIVARHPRRALSNSSSFLWSATTENAAIIPIRPRCPRSTRNKERPLPTAFARSRETGSALSYCGGGMLSVFAVDSDDCRSSNVTRANGSPDIGCSPSDSVDASDGTLKAVATTAGEL